MGEARLENLQRQIEQLTKFRDHLANAVKRWKNAPGEAPKGDAICVLIEQTINSLVTEYRQEEARCPSRLPSAQCSGTSAFGPPQWACLRQLPAGTLWAEFQSSMDQNTA